MAIFDQQDDIELRGKIEEKILGLESEKTQGPNSNARKPGESPGCELGIFSLRLNVRYTNNISVTGQ